MRDSFGRNINYMRISVTDKCNLRCRYCMPEGVEIVPMSALLTFEEIERVCRAASSLGVDRIKVTGGEPLVRRGATTLIGMIKKVPGIRNVTITTNGVLLGKYLDALLAAGIDGINVSLDCMDREMYRQITGRDAFPQVLQGIRLASEAGIRVKVNTLLLQGINDGEWENMVRFAKDHAVDVRFIEVMPIGQGKEYRGVPNPELLVRLRERYPGIREETGIRGNGPAVYYRIPGFSGCIGFISAIHGKFCDRCNRIRMTACGELKPCLCYGQSIDLRRILREGGETELTEALKKAVWKKPGAHCFESEQEITEQKKMISIGG